MNLLATIIIGVLSASVIANPIARQEETLSEVANPSDIAESSLENTIIDQSSSIVTTIAELTPIESTGQGSVVETPVESTSQGSVDETPVDSTSQGSVDETSVAPTIESSAVEPSSEESAVITSLEPTVVESTSESIATGSPIDSSVEGTSTESPAESSAEETVVDTIDTSFIDETASESPVEETSVSPSIEESAQESSEVIPSSSSNPSVEPAESTNEPVDITSVDGSQTVIETLTVTETPSETQIITETPAESTIIPSESTEITVTETLSTSTDENGSTITITQTITVTSNDAEPSASGLYPSCNDNVQFKSNECLLEIWKAAGCLTEYPINESFTDPANAFWRTHSIAVDEADMENYRILSDSHYGYCVKCLGAEDELCISLINPCLNSTIPQTDQCLLYIWQNVTGCTTNYPINEDLSGFWRNNDINSIISDMAKYKEYAVNSTKYCQLCYEDISSCPTESKCDPNVLPNSKECLLEIWYKVGCTSDYPVRHVNNNWWLNQPLQVVENDMAKYYSRSFPSDPKYNSTYAEACMP